ncbi:unnamed protein product [Ostreobium quekettii]|uniref:Protein kinase domain-containing protein n=1 Tax=Ostreobium quekettii TaxID=121088 RepID=A0A8S1J751_9CHLO|nr:unnamed protein product [Ostreobium quekettii]|eukprot:evm.model.scf_3006.1 EVM.evm.TU.scf_3006.1   scf_3006:2908-8573(-)
MAESSGSPGQASDCFTYNQELMALLQEILDDPRMCLDDDRMAVGKRLLAVHALPFNVRHFYTPTEVFSAIGYIGGVRQRSDKTKTAFESDSQLFTQLKHTFECVVKGIHTQFLGRTQIGQQLKNEMETWRIIDSDEVMLLHSWPVDGFPELYSPRATVVLQEARWNNRKVAVVHWQELGRIPEQEQSVRSSAAFLRSAAVQASLANPNVVQLHGITKSCQLIMEMGDSNLKRICRGRCLPWKLRLSLLQQASEGLTYLHTLEQPIAHCRVRTRNFIIFFGEADSCTVKLAAYYPPDLWRHDVWSLECMRGDVCGFGIVAFEIVTGRCPYSPLDPLLDPSQPVGCPPELHKLIRRCCDPVSSHRPTMQEVNQCLQGLQEDWDQSNEQRFVYNNKTMDHFERELDKFEQVASSDLEAEDVMCEVEVGVLNMGRPTAPDGYGSFLMDRAMQLRGGKMPPLRVWRRLLAVHSLPFQVKNFYTPAQLLDEIRATWYYHREWSFDLPALSQACASDNSLYCILQATFADVLGAAEGGTQSEKKDHVRQQLECEMQGWRIIDTDEVALGSIFYECAESVVNKGWWDDEPVAVKSVLGAPVVSPGNARQNEVLACFIREAAIHESLSHPHVVQLHGITASCQLVMELADNNLKQICQGNSLPWRVKLRLLQQASSGLTYLLAKKEPVIHGSISIVSFLIFGCELDRCIVKLAEFGHSTTGHRAEVRGLLGSTIGQTAEADMWRAPEQEVTVKSDVYCFGLVAFEVVTGQCPFMVCQYSQNMSALWNNPSWVRPVDCPPELLTVMQRCCNADPLKRPTMEEVNQCLWGLPEAWSIEMNIEAIAERISENLRQTKECAAFQLKYNHKLMGFLLQQMEKAENIVRCMPGKPPEPQDAQQWWASWIDLKDAVELGCTLIRRHSKKFDLQKFYSAQEAEEGVKVACAKMSRIAKRWNIAIQIETVVPEAVVNEDEEFLQTCLAYLFADEVGFLDWFKRWFSSRGLSLLYCWPRVKDCLAHKMSELAITKDGKLHFIDMIGSSRHVVYSAEWQDRKVAVKRLLPPNAELDPQHFVQFFSEAFIQASLKHPHIVDLLAVSKSGVMVMELAECDLETLYREQELSWNTKTRFLLQVAEGLEHMHGRDPPVVHCDVKSSNLLFFGDRNLPQEGNLKLSDFGISVEDKSTGPLTVRCPGGTPHWMAPELYGNEHPSMAADVFSFGVVVHELASQSFPYGGKGTPYNCVHLMKSEGQPPCVLPSDCPVEIRQLAARCCSIVPRHRPTMTEVKKVLSAAALGRA